MRVVIDFDTSPGPWTGSLHTEPAGTPTTFDSRLDLLRLLETVLDARDGTRSGRQ